MAKNAFKSTHEPTKKGTSIGRSPKSMATMNKS